MFRPRHAISHGKATPDLLRVCDAARALSIPRNHVYTLLRQGKLESIPIKRRETRITRASLNEELARRKAVPPPCSDNSSQ